MKRIFSLWLLILSFSLSSVSAEESNVMILAETTIYEDIQETIILQETQQNVIGDVKGFIRNENVQHPKSMFVIRETTTKDDDDKQVTSL